MGLPLSLNAESYTRVLGAKGGSCSAFWRHRDEENAKRVVWDFLRRPCVGEKRGSSAGRHAADGDSGECIAR